MTLDLTQYTIEELITLKSEIESRISSYVDGYLYICNVRSYGRNWTERVNNVHNLRDLCYRYDGDDGIVDVYSTNPDFSMIENYGDVMYIVSEGDYNNWKEYEFRKNMIPKISKELDEWDDRNNVPFNSRPTFSPIYSKEDLSEMEKELAEFDMSFTPPVRYSNK
jgi:hypothetical protein